MKKNLRWLFLLLIIVSSQAFTQFKIEGFTVNNGGGKSESATYNITASIGQADASQKLIGNTYSVTGGFWSTTNNDDVIFKNSFED